MQLASPAVALTTITLFKTSPYGKITCPLSLVMSPPFQLFIKSLFGVCPLRATRGFRGKNSVMAGFKAKEEADLFPDQLSQSTNKYSMAQVTMKNITSPSLSILDPYSHKGLGDFTVP